MLYEVITEPPQAVVGLINVALLRNTAAYLGITEITQRNDNMLFYIKEPAMQQISALSAEFKGRVLFNSTQKPYISVKLATKQKSAELMAQVIEILNQSRPNSSPV